MSEVLNLGQIRSQVETYLMNTSTDVNSLSWSVAELNGYINEAVFYTQQVTEWFEDFANIVCTASVSTYTGLPNVYQYQRFTWDRDFLPQTNEYELDRDDPSWRLAPPNISPYRFYFPQMGQQFQIVPYPTPSQNGLSYISSNATASDNFNRANQNPINTNWKIRGIGGYVLGQVLNNQYIGQSGSACDMVYDGGISWPNDQFTQATLQTFNGGKGYPVLLLRCSSANPNGYIALLDNAGFGTSNGLKIFQGPPTAVASTSVIPQPGDIFKAQIIGNTITVYQNGTLVLTYTDVANTYPSGKPGIGASPIFGVAGDIAWDNWSAGGVTSGEAGVVCNFQNADGTADTSYQFNQEKGIVIGVADTNGAIIMFRPDYISNPFTLVSAELGELQIYSTDELNLGTAFTRIPDTMVLDTDIPQLPPNSHFGLVLYTLMKCFVREGEFQDQQEASGWFEAYGDWMESVLENKARRWPTRVKSMEPFESGSLFAKRMNAIGYPMQLDLQPSYGP